jgi:hypothetical protein
VWGLYWSRPFVAQATLKALLNMTFGVAGLWYLIEAETMTYSKGALAQAYLAAHLPYAELVDRAAERRYAWEPADEGRREGPEHAQFREHYLAFAAAVRQEVERRRLNEFHVLRTTQAGIIWKGGSG